MAGLTLLNLIALGWAWLDHSWGAIAIAFFLGPGINGLLAFFAILYLYDASQFPGFSAWKYCLTYIGFPLAMIVVVWLAVGMMPLHGG
jgi:hypothetical protein